MKYKVGFYRYYMWTQKAEFDDLNDAIIDALILNKSLNDGDDGISSIRFERMEVTIGNSQLKHLVEDNFKPIRSLDD